jgi:HK97 family phage major capsid protein
MPNRLQDLLIETRSIPVMPETYDEKTHSVMATAITESRVRVWDWERWEVVDEIILINGVELPEDDQCPMVDSHNYSSVDNLLGSARQFTKENDKINCRLFFSSVQKAVDAEIKVKEGHLNRVSSGYIVKQSVWVEDGTAATINGRQFTGPVKVVTACREKEVSPVILPADENSAIRSLRSHPNIMNELIAAGLSPNSTNEEMRNFIKQQFNPQSKRKDQQIMDEELKKLQLQMQEANRKAEERIAALETANQTAKTEAEKKNKRAADIEEIVSIAARNADVPGVVELAQKAMKEETIDVQKFTNDVLEKVRTAPSNVPAKETELRIDATGVMQFGVKPWQKRAVKYLNATVREAKGDKEKSSLLFGEIRSEVSKMSDVQKNDELREAAQIITGSGIGKMQQYRLLSSLSAGAGGNLIPVPMLAEIFVEVEKWGVARRYFTPIPMSGAGNSLALDSLTTEAIGYWVAEGALITPADVAFGQATLSVYKLAAITSWTTELPEDSAIAFLPVVTDSIARALRKKEDLAGFIGDGTAAYGTFTGMLNFAGKIVTMAPGKTAFSQANADDYRALRDAVNIDFRDNAMWFLSPDQVSGVEGLKDAQGNYIYRAPAAGLPAMLWGYPIADSVGINALTQTSAPATKFAIFGNPRVMLMGMKREVTLIASREGVLSDGAGAIVLNALQQDAEILQATERVGFKGTRANYLAALKTAAA